MWPVEVVVGGKLPEDADQMSLVEDDDVVQALSAEGPRSLSAIALAFGARYGVRIPMTPAAASLASKSLP